MLTFEQWETFVRQIPVRHSDIPSVARRLVDVEASGQQAGAWHEAMNFYGLTSVCPCFRCMAGRGETEATAGRAMRAARQRLRGIVRGTAC